MKRLIPGLVICSALVAVGAGAVAFSRATPWSGIWDAVLIVATLVFLALFVKLLAGKAAATLADGGPEAGRAGEEGGMRRDSRSAQPDDIRGGQNSQSAEGAARSPVPGKESLR